ncbi:hypothetical protein Dda_3279 [Drechslerella dactyloides]|uniref:Uncharacterized protein n=1 Tax=Drechslerella dactyloides TaxID=74499 RepID=A0AAD6J5G1_DREDA|nr:hypothetical protein Dda_3279 [Drechslerella dactyloides]
MGSSKKSNRMGDTDTMDLIKGNTRFVRGRRWIRLEATSARKPLDDSRGEERIDGRSGDGWMDGVIIISAGELCLLTATLASSEKYDSTGYHEIGFVSVRPHTPNPGLTLRSGTRETQEALRSKEPLRKDQKEGKEKREEGRDREEMEEEK